MMTHHPNIILVFLSACVIFLSSAPLASAYLLSYYGDKYAASVAYSTVPANFGRPFPQDSADGLALNIFLPPLDVFWDLCDVTNITSSAVSTDTDTGSSSNADSGTNTTDATDTGTGTANSTDNSTAPVRSLRGNDDSFAFDRERYGIHRQSIALIITRGDCTFQEKATNAIALNQHFLNSSTLSRKRSRELGLNRRGLLLDPEPQPQIDFLIVMNSKFAPNPDSPFSMGKFNESDPYIDMSLLSIGFSSGVHLLTDMLKESLKYDNADASSVRFLDSTAFLPLDSAERTGEEWLFPVSVDGLPPRRGSTRARFLLIFVFVTLMFPVVRMLMYCCVHYHDLQWRRNERGWIVGFNWTRRNHEGNEGVWNLAGFQMGVVRGRPVTHTLTKEQVCALPTIQFGVDDLKDVIRKYRGEEVENEVGRTGAEDLEGTSASTNLEAKPPAEVSTVEQNNAGIDILSNEVDARVDTEDTANDTEGATNDAEDAPVEKKDNAFVQAAFDSCVSCSICICEFEHGEEIRLLPECGHAFHTECILPWLTEKKNLCPLCQQKVNESGRVHQERLSFPLSSLNGEHFLNEANPGNVERNDAQSPLAANSSGDEEEGTIRNSPASESDAADQFRQPASNRVR